MRHVRERAEVEAGGAGGTEAGVVVVEVTAAVVAGAAVVGEEAGADTIAEAGRDYRTTDQLGSVSSRMVIRASERPQRVTAVRSLRLAHRCT